LLRSDFEGREVQIRTQECIARKKINRGCPQGSILGPISWSTYLDHLLGLIDKEESIRDFAAYADNLGILISGNSCRELEIKANTAVRTIHNWCERYKMTMSPTKIMAILCGKTLTRKPIIKLHNHPSSKRRRNVTRHHVGSDSTSPNTSTYPWRKQGHNSTRS